MMKQYTSLLLLLAVGLMVPGLDAVRSKKAQSSITAGKVLGGLGLAGVGAAGAYYAYDKDDASKKFDAAKKYLSSTRDSVVDYLKKADNKTIGLGLLGTAAASYIAYKLFIQQKDEEGIDRLAREVPDTDAILKNLGARKSQPIASKKPTSKPVAKSSEANFEEWLKHSGSLLWQVFAYVKDENKRRSMIKPYIEIIARDPHQLIRDKKLMEVLTIDQKLQLLQIFVDYTMDRIIKAAQTLNGTLRRDQEGAKLMLEEALEAAIIQKESFALVGRMHTLVTEKYISGEQTKFVKGELAIIKQCEKIQARFSDDNNLDELLARRLQPEGVQAKPQMRKAFPNRR